VGWNLRPRGPLCRPQMSPQFKHAVQLAAGRGWDRDKTPRQLKERLMLGALDVDSAGRARSSPSWKSRDYGCASAWWLCCSSPDDWLSSSRY
jgi:hypothetical protein